jgi:hypothetical protein
MKNQNNVKKYSELSQLDTFEERYKYLRVYGSVGADTFGFDRYLNQQLYKSPEWKRVRNIVIARDNACDLGIQGRDLHGRIYVHHMNPIGISDIEESSDFLLNPEYLICVSMETHNAIHYGNESFLERNKVVTRTTNDTSPWKK